MRFQKDMLSQMNVSTKDTNTTTFITNSLNSIQTRETSIEQKNGRNDQETSEKLYFTTNAEYSALKKRLLYARRKQYKLDKYWNEPEVNMFKIRGKNYLKDKVKIQATEKMFELVHVDVFHGKKDEFSHISKNPKSFVQLCKERDDPLNVTFFVLNLLIPGKPDICIATYYAMKSDTMSKHEPFHLLWKRFNEGSNSFRSERLKIIPNIVEGPWVIRKGVGNRPVILAKALEVDFFKGSNYLEAFVDIGSDAVASKITSLCRKNLKKLSIDLAIVLQGESTEELPEAILGCARYSKLDLSESEDLLCNGTS